MANPFDYALNSAPYSDEYKMVFKWSHSLNNYNTSEFKDFRDSKISLNEFEGFMDSLRKGSLYYVRKNLLKTPWYITLIQYSSYVVIIILLVMYFTLKASFQFFPFLGLIIIVYLFLMFFLMKKHLKKVA